MVVIDSVRNRKFDLVDMGMIRRFCKIAMLSCLSNKISNKKFNVYFSFYDIKLNRMISISIVMIDLYLMNKKVINESVFIDFDFNQNILKIIEMSFY